MLQLQRRPQPASGLVLALGLALGWVLAGGRAPRLRAEASLPDGRSILATGPVMLQHNRKIGGPVAQDAVYYLNPYTGYLYVTIPSTRTSPAGTQVLGDFAEYDLAKDFQIAPGAPCHFALATAAMGSQEDGWAPLLVFETTTGQVAVYRVTPTIIGSSTKPLVQRVEYRRDPRFVDRPAPR
ncbi:MAG: hypothetical protein IRY99_16910 [Isosphaeraceae bacterium]|nr:hypothetical protein [Isosphaeraceae bacterium]